MLLVEVKKEGWVTQSEYPEAFEALYIHSRDPFLGQSKPKALFPRDAPNKARLDFGANSHTTRSPFDKAQEYTQLHSRRKEQETEFPSGVLKPFLIVL